MIYFIGAGAGDVELLTLKAARIIKKADVIIYAGSLINKEILKLAKKNALIYDSSKLALGDIIEIMLKAEKKNKIVARLHSGDPSIYGAIKEQIEALEKSNADFEIVAGVSSFLAAAARLKKEYTVPEISQTLIITRAGGRTKVPEKERLRKLAAHGASMCIFLSADKINEIVKELTSSYGKDAAVVIAHKVSWKDEKIIKGKLSSIAEKVKKANIKGTALILVGEFLEAEGKRSKLYDKDFEHSFRKRK